MLRIHSPQFERYLRTIARHELRQSDALLREFRRRTRFNWVRTCGRMLTWGVLAFGMLIMPLALSMPIIGLGVMRTGARWRARTMDLK